ncbi:TPM domain-containing protein [Pseudoflavitalea sp. X16]|uniref:TPM domain-containing protein n=1 Tax=Paraflavitalea devenefica TaxID=2716334 RepID=UPI001420EEAC|nr:TPM domain-containing protein [Paraflavitalea devenefica]NII25338.1 TPM domain-containing protein [Paraflavitalea devenefica]
MAFFPFSRKSDFFSADEKKQVIKAIQDAELATSGEIRVYIESRCRYVDPLDRAAELFWSLKMDYTKDHNAVLVYVAVRDHQFAVFADQGIHEKVGNEFWNKEVQAMKKHFVQNHYADAVVQVVTDVGAALQHHFPFNRETDKNELPDDIIFGH